MPTQPRRRTRKPEGKQTAEHQSDQNDEPHTHTPSTPAAPVNEQGWCPSRSTTFKLFFTVRTCGAIWSIIMDCDETFNFWEPGHFLVYKHGFQTWEYRYVYDINKYSKTIITIATLQSLVCVTLVCVLDSSCGDYILVRKTLGGRQSPSFLHSSGYIGIGIILV